MNTRRNTAPQQTAAQAYAESAENIKLLMALLEVKLAEHAKRQAADPRNWGYAGDLKHIESELTALVSTDDCD